MPQVKKIITCPGCRKSKVHYSRGYCQACYTRQRRAEARTPTPMPEKKWSLDSWRNSPD